MLKMDTPPTVGTTLSARLMDVLNRQEVVYCHWKSNERLDEGMRGETDLDLFVARNSFDQTIAILLDLRFKQAYVRSGVATPGVLHFYAFDPEVADFIHVHLYCRLLTGESLVKTHVLPLDNLLLNQTERRGKIQVPAPDSEAAVFVLRSFIKCGSVLHSFLHDRGGDPSEFWFPNQGVTAVTAFEQLAPFKTGIEPELFFQCFDALANNASWYQRWKLGRRVRRHLRGWQRFSAVGRMKAYARVIASKLWRIRHGNMNNKVLQSGGAVVAFIGGDATGKSTLVNLTGDWLGKNLAVRCVHIGKPKSSPITLPLDILLPLARLCFPSQRHQFLQEEETNETTEVGRSRTSIIYALRAVTLAWNRSRLLRATHRYAAAGEIVICDRYPADRPGVTDGPRLSSNREHGWLVKLLTQLEHRLYAEHPSPDIVIRLHVSIETAQKRNQLREKSDKHGERDLEIRHRKIAGWSRSGIKSMHDISTETSPDETFQAVQQAIWEYL